MGARTPQSLGAKTSMTGMEGMAGTEGGDEEGMTVSPSADTDRSDYKT